ncbi:hypothetical protein QGQ84_12485 [Bacillus safensis]|uniref:hypothetical protein n=1 Tax=Bacillus safensis TaxID=561879 RepID=UPI002481F047|nr:hypothetical protein [Bacillus safensis]MDI0274408.1 hypothetical protein [Bacillus safensis]
MIYDKEKYNKGKKKLITQPIIYVEGYTNKIFYQQLNELKENFIENGGNSSEIRKKVDSEINCYGIVDHDYTHITHEKIFPINFYSVENISLIYIKELDDLRNALIKYIDDNTLELARLHLPNLNIQYDKNSKRVTTYELVLTERKHHNQYEEYIAEKVISNSAFMKYTNIKKVVEKYIKFYKRKYGVKINHIIDLADYIPSKTIKMIFSENTLNRFEIIFIDGK